MGIKRASMSLPAILVLSVSYLVISGVTGISQLAGASPGVLALEVVLSAHWVFALIGFTGSYAAAWTLLVAPSVQGAREAGPGLIALYLGLILFSTIAVPLEPLVGLAAFSLGLVMLLVHAVRSLLRVGATGAPLGPSVYLLMATPGVAAVLTLFWITGAVEGVEPFSLSMALLSFPVALMISVTPLALGSTRGATWGRGPSYALYASYALAVIGVVLISTYVIRLVALGGLLIAAAGLVMVPVLLSPGRGYQYAAAAAAYAWLLASGILALISVSAAATQYYHGAPVRFAVIHMAAAGFVLNAIVSLEPMLTSRYYGIGQPGIRAYTVLWLALNASLALGVAAGLAGIQWLAVLLLAAVGVCMAVYYVTLARVILASALKR